MITEILIYEDFNSIIKIYHFEISQTFLDENTFVLTLPSASNTIRSVKLN